MIVAFRALDARAQENLGGRFHCIARVTRRSVEVASRILSRAARRKQNVTGKCVIRLILRDAVFEPALNLCVLAVPISFVEIRNRSPHFWAQNFANSFVAETINRIDRLSGLVSSERVDFGFAGQDANCVDEHCRMNC